MTGYLNEIFESVSNATLDELYDFSSRLLGDVVPPEPPLVGIETNPGPRNKMRVGPRARKTTAVLVQAKTKNKSSKPVQIGKTTISRVYQPLAENIQFQKSIAFSNARFENRNGLRVNGRQRLIDIITDVNGIAKFSNVAPGGGATTVNCLQINPLLMGGELNTIGGAFLQYVFRNLRFYYVPLCSTTASGPINVGYNPDGGGNTTPTPTYIQSLGNGKEFVPYIQSMVDANPDLDTSHLYFNYYGGSGDAREEYQGLLLIGATSGGISPVSSTIGTFWVEFSIEFYGMGNLSGLQLNDRLFKSELIRIRERLKSLKVQWGEYKDAREKKREDPSIDELLYGISEEVGVSRPRDLVPPSSSSSGEKPTSVGEPGKQKSLLDSPSATFGKRSL